MYRIVSNRIASFVLRLFVHQLAHSLQDVLFIRVDVARPLLNSAAFAQPDRLGHLRTRTPLVWTLKASLNNTYISNSNTLYIVKRNDSRQLPAYYLRDKAEVVRNEHYAAVERVYCVRQRVDRLNVLQHTWMAYGQQICANSLVSVQICIMECTITITIGDVY